MADKFVGGCLLVLAALIVIGLAGLLLPVIGFALGFLGIVALIVLAAKLIANIVT